MDKHVTENAIDFLKTTTALAPPGASMLFGITLEEWMFIASIVASLFIALDKLPSILERISEKFKKQSSTSRPSDSDADSSG
jgi:hypothetical protein